MMEKQIEELTNELIRTSRCGTHSAVAEYLYNKGWRKQNYGEYHGSRFTDGAFYQEQCSVCGEWAYDYDKNYCPNCGARIKGGES